MNPEAQWYYEMSGSRQGPVSTEHILSLRRGGVIGDSTLVWSTGFSAWMPFAQSELASQIAASAPAAQASHATSFPPPAPAGMTPYRPRQIQTRPGYRLSIRSTLSRAWGVLKSRFWPIIGVSLLSMIMISVASQLFLPVFFLTLPLMAGLFWYLLMYMRGNEPNTEMLFEGFRRQFKPLAILNLIISGIGMAITIPVAALLVGGIFAIFGVENHQEPNPTVLFGVIGASLLVYFFLLLAYSFLGIVGVLASMLVLDGEIPVKQALSMSWQVVKSQWFRFLLFLAAVFAMTFIGVLALYVGSFIAMALSLVAYVVIYEDAFCDTTEAAQ